MPHVLIQHEVADYDDWKPYFDAYESTREAKGQEGYQLFQAVGDRNDVVILLEFDTMEGARSFGDSTTLRKRMVEAGVEGDTEIRYLKQVDELTTRQSA